MQCGSKEVSENQEVGECIAGVKAANGLYQKWRHWKNINLYSRRGVAETESGHRVGHNDAVDGRIREHSFGARHE